MRCELGMWYILVSGTGRHVQSCLPDKGCGAELCAVRGVVQSCVRYRGCGAELCAVQTFVW